MVELLSWGIEVFCPEHRARVALLLALLPSPLSSSPPLPPPPSAEEDSASTDLDPVALLRQRPLDPWARSELLSRLCQRLGSSLHLTLPFLPPSLRQLPAILPSARGRAPLTWLNASLSTVAVTGDEEGERMRVGALVERGPDWRWDDQDGGPGKHGLVVALGEWEAGYKVRVVWGEAGCACNVYRYRVREGRGLVSDVQLVQDRAATEAAKKRAEAGKKVVPEHSLEAVKAALTRGRGEGGGRAGGPLNKRVIIRYMRDNAPSAWLADQGLDGPENAVVRELDNDAVIRLYTAFCEQLGGATEGPESAPEEEQGGPRGAWDEELRQVLGMLEAALREKADEGLATLIGSLQVIMSAMLKVRTHATPCAATRSDCWAMLTTSNTLHMDSHSFVSLSGYDRRPMTRRVLSAWTCSRCFSSTPRR